ncbi:MAG: type I toxin-antitoxin system SymE family toxin [Parabacteroides sp.]|nr:type I toxin-antitoxin system SymE family toxin [Parabacteroides sp.]
MEKYLKCVNAPYGNRYTVGINLKGDYLKEFNFFVGDCVKVELSENRIIITKSDATAQLTLLQAQNPNLLNLIDNLGLTIVQ